MRHVARYLAVRLEHSDEGEDLQLALLLRRHLRGVAAVREERVLALDDAKTLQAVAEERGHRDVAVLDLGVAKEPAVWSLSSVQNDMPEQPTASQKPGLRPSDEPSARSISSSCADQVATDERATDTAVQNLIKRVRFRDLAENTSGLTLVPKRTIWQQASLPVGTPWKVSCVILPENSSHNFSTCQVNHQSFNIVHLRVANERACHAARITVAIRNLLLRAVAHNQATERK